MQHFHTLLLLGELLLKLHALSALALVGIRHPEYAERRYAELVRAPGSAAWAQALRAATTRLQPLDPVFQRGAIDAWFEQFQDWLARKHRRADRDSLEEALGPLDELYSELVGTGLKAPGRGVLPTPVLLLEMVGIIRNKTTGHGAFGSEFYRDGVPRLAPALDWVCATSPLWKVDPVGWVAAGDGPRALRLRGNEPFEEAQLRDPPAQEAVLLALGERSITTLSPLIHIEQTTSDTFLSNGGWRESEASAEFLCYTLEAAHPQQGRRRRILSQYTFAGELGESETAGRPEFEAHRGVVLNNLPLRMEQYVPRPGPEKQVRAVLWDHRRKHLVMVRGLGGIGKTSLILHLCHELARRPEDCPYDFIVWLSARDIDLTVGGAKEVRRETASLRAVFDRFAQAHGESLAPDERKQFFENAVGNDRYLIVLDNFETFEDQETAYRYFDQTIYPPSKLVLTSRHDFDFQYKTRLPGMEQDEARQLLRHAAREAGTEPAMTDAAVESIWNRCQGHPYAMKLIAGQTRTHSGIGGLLPRVLRQDELLDALFRRSFEDLADDHEAVFIFLAISQFNGGLPEPALKVLATLEELDLDSALKDLHARSLIELEEGAEWAHYNMPAMAREFARHKLIVGHLLQRQVLESTDFLRRCPSLVVGNVNRAAIALGRELIRNVEERTVVALEALATFDPSVWPLVARDLARAGAPKDQLKRAYKRAVEEDPANAALLYEYARAVDNPDLQIELQVQAVGLDPENVERASQVALLLNELYQREPERYPRLQWGALMKRVAEALEANYATLKGPELARLGGLYVNSDRTSAAARILAHAQRVDPDDPDIKRLARRRELASARH